MSDQRSDEVAEHVDRAGSQQGGARGADADDPVGREVYLGHRLAGLRDGGSR